MEASGEKEASDEIQMPWKVEEVEEEEVKEVKKEEVEEEEVKEVKKEEVEEEEVKKEVKQEEQEQEQEQEGDGDFCANMLSAFISSLESQQWESLRERMREPLTQTRLIEVSRRIITVVSDLVFQVLVPALQVHLEAPPSGEAAAEEEEEEEEEESPAPPQLPPPWADVELYLDPATETVICSIADSLAASLDATQPGGGAACGACRILKSLARKMRCTKGEEEEEEEEGEEEEEEGEMSDLDSLYGFSGCSSGCSLHQTLEKVKGVFRRGGGGAAPAFPLTVSSGQVLRVLSSRRFRDASLNVLEEFLVRSLLRFSIYFSEAAATAAAAAEGSAAEGSAAASDPPPPSAGAAASEMLDAVVDDVADMCRPAAAAKGAFPWRRSDSATVSEEQVTSAAARLKAFLRATLRRFFRCSRAASDRASAASDKASGSSSGDSMASVVKSLLEQSAAPPPGRGGEGGEGGEATLAGLEELIRQDKMLVSQMLAGKLSGMFRRVARGARGPPGLGRRAWSDTELSRSARDAVGLVVPADRVYAFVEEAVRRLLTPLIFPPASWGMGHAAPEGGGGGARGAAAGERFEAVIGLYSELMAQQVMGNLGGAAGGADGRRHREVTERETSAVLFFQELPNRIRTNWVCLTDKDD